jgi:outer membrane protein TolC
VREAQYAAQVSAADLENERLTEQASLAEYFFEIRGQDQLQQIYNDTVEADKKALELTRALYETGIDDQISVVEAETTLQSVEAGATNVGIARAQYEHAIAVLIGKSPSAFSIPVKPMTVAPPPIPIGVPSQLLERRPDIAAAERTMAGANAAIGIAYAAYYPNLTLTAKAALTVRPSRIGSPGRPASGPSERRSRKPFSTPACAAPRSSNTLRPTMPI